MELVTAMAVPEGIRDVLPINICISEQDFRKGMRGLMETTSTSPSGRHLGHYKVAIDTERLSIDAKYPRLNLGSSQEDGKTRYRSC